MSVQCVCPLAAGTTRFGLTKAGEGALITNTSVSAICAGASRKEKKILVRLFDLVAATLIYTKTVCLVRVDHKTRRVQVLLKLPTAKLVPTNPGYA